MRFFITLICVLISLVCLNCTKAQQVAKYPVKIEKEVYIDPGFDYEEKIQIINALKTWECSTNNSIKFTLITEKPTYPTYLSIEQVDSGDERVVKWDAETSILYKKETKAVGYFYLKNQVSTILLVDDRLDGEVKATTIHEVGHSLGLDHIDLDGAIMNKTINIYTGNITIDDIEALCQKYYCNEPFVVCNTKN